MITKDRASGYFETSHDGVRTQGETRQCVHCQFTWEYRPGSGIRRGWCMKCQGLLCGRPECEAQQQRILASYPGLTSASRTCMPYADMVQRQRDRLAHDPRFTVLPSGVVVATASLTD